MKATTRNDKSDINPTCIDGDLFVQGHSPSAGSLEKYVRTRIRNRNAAAV